MKPLLAENEQRQATIGQHLALMRQRGIVRAGRTGIELHYSPADIRILDACHITHERLLNRLSRQGTLAGMRAR